MNKINPNTKSGAFIVTDNQQLSSAYSLLVLKPEDDTDLKSADFKAGQFVEVLPPANSTFLRRPISVCNVDETTNTLWLLIRDAGAGTHALNASQPGQKIDIIYPLGHGFSTTLPKASKVLLIGGGVGVAPLIYLGRKLKEAGIEPIFLLGARSKSDLLLLDKFNEIGKVFCSTDDGSFGTPGVVTQNPVINDNFDMMFTCGPMPMMKAVARVAQQNKVECEVSLENVMGCGLGACLCCVEKTKDEGNVCVCTEGPVFNVKRLLW